MKRKSQNTLSLRLQYNRLQKSYMSTPTTTPTYLFESSWEVCNKVGGIYTVLSTKAFSLKKIFDDKAIFIGPDVWEQEPAVDFIEDNSLLPNGENMP